MSDDECTCQPIIDMAKAMFGADYDTSGLFAWYCPIHDLHFRKRIYEFGKAVPRSSNSSPDEEN